MTFVCAESDSVIGENQAKWYLNLYLYVSESMILYGTTFLEKLIMAEVVISFNSLISSYFYLKLTQMLPFHHRLLGHDQENWG